MFGNTIGVLFRVTTFGESHGPAIGCVIDGCPPGIKITQEAIQHELDRRRPGQSHITTSRVESDHCEILSGIFEDLTTGTPIGILIRNQGADPHAYESLRNVFRPGHADYTYQARYGIRDHRGGGRSSGRETAARVAAGAIAKLILAWDEIKIFAHTIRIGAVKARKFRREEIELNPVRCADPKAAVSMVKAIIEAQKAGDSLGGIVEVIAEGVPAGLGEPVFGKLDAELAAAIMGIGAVKGVEFGAGFKSAEMRGSEMNDPILSKGGRITTLSNHAGGILGGVSTGDNIVMRLAVKPTPSISLPQRTVDDKGRRKTLKISGRHDPCICPRIVPVAEAMTAIVLADHILRLRAIRNS